MMPKPKKNGKALNIILEAELYNRLEELSNKTRLTKTAIVELSLEKYLKKQENSSTKG